MTESKVPFCQKVYRFITIGRKILWCPKCEKNTIKLIEAISLYREGARPPFVDNLEVGAWIDIKRVILPIAYVRAHKVIENGIHTYFSVQKRASTFVGKVVRVAFMSQKNGARVVSV